MDANAAQPQSRRRWYQFGLRTLLIGVALAGCGLAYVKHEAGIVSTRNAWLEANPDPPRTVQTLLAPSPTPNVVGDPNRSPTIVRRWLGDEAKSDVFVEVGQLKDAAELFPEASIWKLDYGNR